MLSATRQTIYHRDTNQDAQISGNHLTIQQNTSDITLLRGKVAIGTIVDDTFPFQDDHIQIGFKRAGNNVHVVFQPTSTAVGGHLAVRYLEQGTDQTKTFIWTGIANIAHGSDAYVGATDNATTAPGTPPTAFSATTKQEVHVSIMLGGGSLIYEASISVGSFGAAGAEQYMMVTKKLR